MRAVWMVRGAQILRKLGWWLALIGYDPRDHSLNQKLYLVYASLFWGGWFFAMFSLFAEPALILLQALGALPLEKVAAALSSLALLGWGAYQLWQATRCSPFIFSENDAHLICQAPVSSKTVALAWLLGDWFEPAAPFWAGAVVLSIALVNSRITDKIGLADLPTYLMAGGQALVLVALVQFGLMALIWAAGALRLQRDRLLRWQPRAVRLAILAAGAVLVANLLGQGLGGLSQPLWQVIFWPITYPLSAAFGAAPAGWGLFIGLAWVGLGLAALAQTSNNLNLSRAAQETTQKELIASAQRYGQTGLAQHTLLTTRLGGGHPPSRLSTRPGEWMLSWKDMIQSVRALQLADLWSWLSLIAAGFAVCLVPDFGARGLALAIWGVMVGQRITARLQDDLAHWSLLRLLPFSSGRLLVADLALPWALVVLSGWGTLALAGAGWSTPIRMAAALLLPILCTSIAFAMAYDLFRQSRSELLLNGNAPQASSAGGLLGLLCLALPLGVWLLLDLPWLDSSLPAILLAGLLALVFWRLASQTLQRIN